MERSPITYVGNVKTPTMMITGEDDHRTPSSEAEQFYQALKLRKVDTALLRIPGASHEINTRPSNMLAQVLNTIGWFELHRAIPMNGSADREVGVRTPARRLARAAARVDVYGRRRDVQPGDAGAPRLEAQLVQKIARDRARRPVGELDEAAALAKHVEDAGEDRALRRTRDREHAKTTDDGVDAACLVREPAVADDRLQLLRIAADDVRPPESAASGAGAAPRSARRRGASPAAMPCSSSACVKTPVPPPSSTMCRAPAGSCSIISFASWRLEGDSAAIARGLRSHWRKNVHASGWTGVLPCRPCVSRLARGRSWLMHVLPGEAAIIARGAGRRPLRRTMPKSGARK